MPNAVGYLADYLNNITGTEATEVAAAITARVNLTALHKRYDLRDWSETITQATMQQALTDVGAWGGGELWFPPSGVLVPTDTLLIPSGVHVRGQGRGGCVLRPPAGAYAGKSVAGATVFATFAMVGVNDASVKGVTLDHATNGTTANGIVVIQNGAQVPSKRCEVMHNAVYFSVASQYLYWCYKSNDNLFAFNYANGGFATNGSGAQEGFENFGGTNNLFFDNLSEDIRGNGFYAAAADDSGGLNGSRWVQNVSRRCKVGFRALVGLNSKDISVRGHRSLDCWEEPLKATFSSGVTVDGFVVEDFNSQGGTQVYLAAEAGVVSSRMRFEMATTDTSSTEAAIKVANLTDIQIDMDVKSSAGSGVIAEGCTDIDVTGTLNGAVGSAVRFDTCTRANVTGAKLRGYNQANDTSQGIAYLNTTKGVAGYNRFRPANESVAIDVTSTGSSGIRTPKNILEYAAAFSNPINNAGLNPGRGTFSATAGTTETAVINSTARQDITPTIWQISGTPLPFTFTKQAGGFTIFHAAAGSGVTFGYDIG